MGLKANVLQIGSDTGTADKQFHWRVPMPPDGRLILSRGIEGAPTEDLMIVAADGKTTFPKGALGFDDAWTTAGMGVTPATGAFADANATISYKKVGRVVEFRMTINIVSNGSGAGAVRATLPFAAAGTHVFAGRANALTGKMLQGLSSGGSTLVTIWDYASLYPAASGEILLLSGSYESTT